MQDTEVFLPSKALKDKEFSSDHVLEMSAAHSCTCKQPDIMPLAGPWACRLGGVRDRGGRRNWVSRGMEENPVVSSARSLYWLATVSAAVACSPTPPKESSSGTVGSGHPTALTCEAEGASPEAFLKAGKYGPDEAILPNGRRLTPVGSRIPTRRFPLGFRVNRDETRAYVVHNGDDWLVVLDLVQQKQVQAVAIRSPFKAVALSPDEATLAVGGGSTGRLTFFKVGEDGHVTADGEIYLGGYLADVEFSPDGTRIYAVANTNSRLYVLDSASRAVVATFKAGTYPYDLVLSSDGLVAWVSNLQASTVQAISTLDGKVLASLAVGKNPTALTLSPDASRLYVANSDSDTVSVIDTLKREVIATVHLTGDLVPLTHGNVNGVSVSPDGTRLYVSQGGFNQVDVVDTATYRVLGSIPTGWYPTEVLAGRSALYVASSKGMGSEGVSGLKNLKSFLQVVPYPDAEQLDIWTEKVKSNNRRTLDFFQGACEPSAIPVLRGPPESPIRHVVLVVRENKTYDMVLGDFERGDGDPNLVVFGEEVTPNYRKLAREFVTFDNFYSNPEASYQGHMWTTTAQCNDYVEKTYWDQLSMVGYEVATLPEAGTIFSHLLAHGVPFRVYGEFPSFSPGMFEEYADFFDHKFPFWTMEVKDVDKAAEVIREIELGIFPPFVYLILPNNHTYGSKPGKPTPDSMVADNDRATGMLVEAISRSIYWPHTAIFIIEDDPQGSGDHVNAHRSICVVVSPWVKRGYLSSIHYDIPSLYRTIEMILGVPPMGRNDAMAAPMLDIWVDGETIPPDYTPFEAVPVNVPDAVNPEKGPLSTAVDHCDFERIDRCPGLGRVLWKMKKGDVEPPPYAKWIDE